VYKQFLLLIQDKQDISLQLQPSFRSAFQMYFLQTAKHGDRKTCLGDFCVTYVANTTYVIYVTLQLSKNYVFCAFRQITILLKLKVGRDLIQSG